MKKLILTLGIIAIVPTTGIAQFSDHMNCAFWGYTAAKLEEQAYGDMSLAEFDAAHGYYQGLCEEAGGAGNIADPVFLK